MVTPAELTSLLQEMFVIGLRAGGPILITSMALGVLISIFQAATQMHEQTITFVPKLILILVLLMMMGGHILELMQQFVRQLFSMI